MASPSTTRPSTSPVPQRPQPTSGQASTKPHTKRIAVVGSGVAGLSAAFLLAREHDVTVFEREEAVGMDAHSIDAHGSRMDIPLRVFSESYYPNLTNLYNLVGIRYHVADYSFCCVSSSKAAAYFRYVNLFVRGMALPLPALFHPRHLATSLRLAFQFAHFLKYAPVRLAADAACEEMRLSEFLSAHGYSKEFASELLYPMLSVVCTCSYAAVANYPAPIIIDYFCNKYGLSGAQCRAYEGTRDVVQRLTAPVSRVVTSATITSVEAAGAAEAAAAALKGSGPLGAATCRLSWLDGTTGQSESESFDEVVLAMQANASAKVLVSPHAAQRGALARFEYESRRVVLHTDASLMPAHACDHSPLNIVVSPQADAASVTVWMNRIDDDLRRELSRPVYQTWNPHAEPDAATVIADYSFERPVVTADSVKAMADLQAAQGHGHVWFVGAYSRYSMPLLENGVKSAMVVARALGVDTSDVEFDPSALDTNAASTSRRLSLALLVLVVALTLAHGIMYGMW